MKCTIPEISWHNRDPVLSADVQPTKASETVYRLATGGTDSHVLIWLLSLEKAGAAALECAADLTRHTRPVNCVRFSPSGQFLASGDDEACIIIWKMKTGNDPVELAIGEEENFKEQWVSVKVLRGHLQDVYDLCWSADSKNLISGSVDNTAILWDVSSGKNLGILSEHKGFVQGVAWDPCGQYIATMSSDRVCRVYNATTRRVTSRIYKGLLPGVDAESKPTHFFHDDTLKSFFRRLTFTPDGELLIVPSGLVEEPDKKPSNSTIVFSRHCLNKPAVYLPSLSQYTVAVRCCPVLYTLRPMQSPPLFDLPYRVVIAVATQCSVVLYDTQHAAPFAFITKIHYTRLTDLSWSSDGKVLVVSSTDGYCSVITFAENELGTVYTGDNKSSEGKQDQASKIIKTENEDKLESSDNNEKSQGKSVDKNDSQLTNKKVILNESEDANMPFDQNGTQDDPCADKGNSKNILTEEHKSEKCVEANLLNTVSESKAAETPMEVDDFQLEYEGTMTQPIVESKSSVNVKESKDDGSSESGNKSCQPSVELENKSSELADKCAPESPCKSEAKNIHQEALTSPRASGPNGANVTPSNSNKKTPRRVKLITLSSPKSKKQLLQ